MTKIVPTKGEPTAINYRLHRVDDEWKVYDVVVEDISLVVNFRSQFNRILAKGSFDDLLKQLREKETRTKN
jgi:phospholipid transport system substrate-binding protein